MSAVSSAIAARQLRAIVFADHSTPGESAAHFLGLIANIIGPLPEPYWQEILADVQRPCDVPGCDCHTFKSRVFDALDELRSDWIGTVGGRQR